MNNLDPIENDMEQLLHEKGFDELTEAEKAFVLKHIQDAEEYESMRAMLMNIRESLAVEEDFMPDEDLKSSLMAQFEKQNGKVVYLNQSNGFFFPKGRPFYKSPAFQIAVAASIVIAFIMYFPFHNAQAPNQLAQTSEIQKTGELSPDVAEDNGLGTPAEKTDITRTLHDKVVVDGKEMTSEVTKEEAPAELMQDNVPVVADEATVVPPVVVTKKAEKDAFESVNNAVGEVFGNTRDRQDTKYRNEKTEDLDDQISFNSNTESDKKDGNVSGKVQLEEKANKQEYKNLKTETASGVFKDTKSKEKLAAADMEDGSKTPGSKTDLPEKSDKGISLDEKPELMQFFYTSL